MIRWSKTKILVASIAVVIVVVIATSIDPVPTGRIDLIPSTVADTNAFHCGWTNNGASCSLTFIARNPIDSRQALLLQSTTHDDVDVRHGVSSTSMLRVSFTLYSIITTATGSNITMRLMNGNITRLSTSLSITTSTARDYVLILKEGKFTVTEDGTQITGNDVNGNVDRVSLTVSNIQGSVYFIDITAWYTW
jgi:hypothetical protein